MVMFNGAKRFLGTSNFQSKHANILKVRHFPSKQNTKSNNFLKNLARILQDSLQEYCIDLQDLARNLARIFQKLHFFQPRDMTFFLELSEYLLFDKICQKN